MKESLPAKTCSMETQESTAGVSEKIVSVDTASFLLGIFKVGNLNLECFLTVDLVDVTAHWVEFSKFS